MKSYHRYIGSFIALLALFLGGCTTSFDTNKPITGPNLSQNEWESQRNILLDQEKYVTRGAVDIDLLPQGRYGNTTNTQGSANYVYQAEPNSYIFAVTHFMAGVIFKVKKGYGTPGVELLNSDGNKYNFPSEEEFSKAVQIPISRFPFWIMGVTFGDEKEVRRDAQGRLEKFTNNGWVITYYEYDYFDKFVLPKRLIVNNPKIGTIKIEVKSWEF